MLDLTQKDDAGRKGPQNLAQKAADALADMIYKRQVRAGDVLVEHDIAALLGISRTPLRQAMQKLEGQGLLRKGRHSRSYSVRRVELKEYLQSLRVREILEPEAAVLSIDRIGPETVAEARALTEEVARTEPYDKVAHWHADNVVHRLFIDNCGNDVMREMLLSLRVTTNLFEIERLSDRLGPDSREHLRILEALAGSDAKAARKHVRAHIASLFNFAIKTVS